MDNCIMTRHFTHDIEKKDKIHLILQYNVLLY